MATRVRSLGLGFSLDVPFRDSILLPLFVMSFLSSSILFYFVFLLSSWEKLGAADLWDFFFFTPDGR